MARLRYTISGALSWRVGFWYSSRLCQRSPPPPDPRPPGPNGLLGEQRLSVGVSAAGSGAGLRPQPASGDVALSFLTPAPDLARDSVKSWPLI